MRSKSDTLDQLAADLGLERTSPDFHRVWADLSSAGEWAESDLGNKAMYGQIKKAAKRHMQIDRQFETRGGSRPKRLPGVAGWRVMATALEHRAAHEARHDPDLVSFRREVLNGRVVSPIHGDVQAWLRKNTQHRDRLMSLARALADAHWWVPNDALIFVLTDMTPPRPPLRVQVQFQVAGNAAVRIIVDAESWVPAIEVGRAFRRQRDRMQKRVQSEQSRRARALSPRALAVVAFVEGTKGSWRDRLDAWNTANPKARFKDRANFRRTYETARRRLDLSPAFVRA